MPAITTNDLKNGITLELDNGLFQVVEFQHVKPGKGGAFVRTKLRNLKNGNVFDRTFNAGIRVEQAILNRKDMQFLYRDGDDYVFMNNETYEQMHVAPVALGDAADYMVERHDRPGRLLPGRDHLRRDPGVGRADDRRDRARSAGRPCVGRPQAGDARDRQGRPGAAVRQDRRPRQGRHPHAATTSPGCGPMADDGPRSSGPTLASVRCTCSTRPTRRGSPPPTRSTSRCVEPDELTQELVARRRRHTCSGSTQLIAAKAKGWTLARMPVIDLTVMRLAVFELLERPTCRSRSCSTRRSSSPSGSRPTTPGGSSTACWQRSPTCELHLMPTGT